MKSQRNLGTMKRDREERRRLKNATGGGNGEIILRILRMRYVGQNVYDRSVLNVAYRIRSGTQGFLADQLRMMYRAE